MIIHLKNKDKLILNDFKFKCCIGKSGTKKHKIEGDNTTPVGIFTLGNLYYRKDRNIKPITSLKCIPIKKNMGSAIFLHLITKKFNPTQGCIAIRKKDFIKILPHVTKKTKLIIH